jgi:hypothetical protein
MRFNSNNPLNKAIKKRKELKTFEAMPVLSEDHSTPNISTNKSSTPQGDPVLFYFSNDLNVSNLRYLDTEIDLSLDSQIMYKEKPQIP